MAEDTETYTPSLREATRHLIQLIRLIRPYWGPLSKGLLLGPIYGILGMVPPYLTKILIDEVYPSEDVSLMHVIVGGLLAVTITSAILDFLRRYHIYYYQVLAKNRVRLLLFNHLQHLPLAFFTSNRVGTLSNRFKDANAALARLTSIFRMLVSKGVYLFMVPPFLFYLSWKLATVAIVSIPLSVLVVTIVGRRRREASKKSSDAYDRLYAHYVETLSQIQAVKSFALESQMYEITSDKLREATGAQRESRFYQVLVESINKGLWGTNMALFTWLGWTFILNGQMTLGTYIAFTSYVEFLYSPLKKLVRKYLRFQRLAVHLWRIFEYLEESTEMSPFKARMPTSSPSQSLRGKIEFKNVTFAYDEDAILQGFDLTIQPGETLGVVGSSGSGKTTLLRLIAGLYEISHGTLEFDGKPLNEIPLAELRNQVVGVWQDPTLFDGTIRFNLTLGKADVPRSELDRVTQLCQIHELIRNADDGYDSEVSEWGATLSGGQRQRIMLARALIHDAPIYLFDEVTSNLDLQTESALLPLLFDELSDRTVLFVTHRVRSVRQTDRVCMLEKGQVAGVAPHEELQYSCQSYADLCEVGLPSPASNDSSKG